MSKKKKSDLPSPTAFNDEKYESKRDLELVLDHHEMMSDPARVKRIKKLAGRHNKAIKSLSELRDVANNYSKRKGLSADDEAEEKIG